MISGLGWSFRGLPSATPRGPFRKSGTEGSNPLCSSAESATNLVAAGGVARGWDSEFESALLQRRVCCEPERTSICPALPRTALHTPLRPSAGAIRIGVPWRRAPTGIRSLERGRFGPCWKPRNILPAASGLGFKAAERPVRSEARCFRAVRRARNGRDWRPPRSSAGRQSPRCCSNYAA